MDIRQYLDSTYLKTPEQAGLSESENTKIVRSVISEAIQENFKLVMVRPEHVDLARKMVLEAKSQVSVGTVIDFPGGRSPLEDKIREAETAIENGVDELDFVCNYEAFINDDTELVKNEILKCTAFGLEHLKTVKWIIEVAALDVRQIAQLSALIKNVVVSNFTGHYNEVFVKSSTGFYKVESGRSNGATTESIIIILENAAPLPVKAAGGVRSFEEAVAMINLGVKRIGTSAAKEIADGGKSQKGY